MASALVAGDGDAGAALACAKAYESATWLHARYRDIAPHLIRAAYLDAVYGAEQMLLQMQDAGLGRDGAAGTTRTALNGPLQYGSILPVEKLTILPSVAGDRASILLDELGTSGPMGAAPGIAWVSSLVATNTGWKRPTSTPFGLQGTVSSVMYLFSAALLAP